MKVHQSRTTGRADLPPSPWWVSRVPGNTGWEMIPAMQAVRPFDPGPGRAPADRTGSPTAAELKAWRLSHGLTQAAASKKAGFSHPVRWTECESGRKIMLPGRWVKCQASLCSSTTS